MGKHFLSLNKSDMKDMGLFDIISDLLYERIKCAYKRRGQMQILLTREHQSLVLHRTKEWIIYSNTANSLKENPARLLIMRRR